METAFLDHLQTHLRNGPSGHLSRRTLTGGTWLLASQIMVKATNLIQVTILARFLDPKAFGLMDIGNLCIFFIGVFTFTGFDIAIIQKPNLQSEDVHTAWWVLFARSVAIGLILACLAKPVANLYHSAEVVSILLVLAFLQPILGLASASPILFQRNIEFDKIFKLDVGSGVVGLAVGIACAFIFRNVWALLLALCATHTSYMLLSYILHPYRPKLLFDWGRFRKFSHYGGWVLASTICYFVLCQGASAFGGLVFGVASLGVYQMAARFAQFPYNYLGEAIRTVLVPAYSQIQGDKDRLRKAFLRTAGLTSTLIIGITPLVALGLPRLLALILGERWVESLSLVPALAVAGAMQALLRTAYPLYLATGRPRFQFMLDVIQAGAMIGLLFPLGRLFGLGGLPFAMVGGAIVSIPIWWSGIRRCTNCRFKDLLVVFLPSVAGMFSVILIFSIGQAASIFNPDSIGSLLWHIGLIGISVVAFLKTIDIAQRLVPDFSALTDLKSVFQKMGGRDFSNQKEHAVWNR